ncbi:MAG: hypothetical protein AAGA60_15410 [Cyanobacteria bacterium P01_E01_bin.42]
MARICDDFGKLGSHFPVKNLTAIAPMGKIGNFLAKLVEKSQNANGQLQKLKRDNCQIRRWREKCFKLERNPQVWQ